MIRFHNTLTRQAEEFTPLTAGEVRLYTCGPTVYDLAHIGNFRAYVFEDLLHRFLEYSGYRVIRVMNITDVDDKTIAGAKREGISLAEYTGRYTDAFQEDMKRLRLREPDVLPRATGHIPEMAALIQTLLDKGVAYRKDGSIYFRIGAFPGYGRLSHLDPAGIKPGARVEVDEYSKEDVRDFALWKETDEEGFSWETPLGRGRPGWHIECSAMSMKYLGESLDIHTGGMDNIFPHHENEMAQSEAATGKPFVRYWMHCGYLLVNGEKMSKSKGNFYTVRDLLAKGFKPEVIRYLLLATSYRDPLNFTEAGLEQAGNTVRHYQEFHRRLDFCRGTVHSAQLAGRISRAREEFNAALSDDLNISPALAAIFNLMRDVNTQMEKGELDEANAGEIRTFLEDVDRVVAILPEKERALDDEVASLIKEREQARRDKNFARSDEIRGILKQKGILLEDTPQGTRWKRTGDAGNQ